MSKPTYFNLWESVVPTLQHQEEFDAVKEMIKTENRIPQRTHRFEESGWDYVNDAFFSIGLISYEACGKQNYRLGPNLTDEFKRSSVPKIPISELVLPYNAFFVSIPVEAGIMAPNPNHKIWGVLMVDSRPTTKNLVVQVETIDRQPINVVSFLILSADDFSSVQAVYNKSYVNLIIVDATADVETFLKDRHSPAGFFQAVRVVCNLLFYINSSQRELVTTERPDVKRIAELEARIKEIRPGRTHLLQKAQAKLHAAKKQETVTYIAPKLERDIDQEKQRLANEESQHQKVSTGGVRRRHQVTAFWNFYWCGSGDDKHLESRRIASHWRGKSPDEILRKRYQLEIAKE